jgi:hypothetical protein
MGRSDEERERLHRLRSWLDEVEGDDTICVPTDDFAWLLYVAERHLAGMCAKKEVRDGE